MIAKCPKCRFVRISRQRSTCPHCGGKLTRPTGDELRDLGDSMMDRARAARGFFDHNNLQPEVPKLIAFMSIVEGREIDARQARKMLGTP